LTQPAIVEFETYNASDADNGNYGGVGLIPSIDCYYSADTTLALFTSTADVTMDAMAIAVDDDDGDVFCSYLGPEDSGNNVFEGVLEPGTYIIRVGGFAAQSRYILDMFITPAELPVAGDLAINEYMADDGAADTNCDGVAGTGADTDDEFIELVNTSNAYLNINGVRIHDANTLRHTFAAGPTGFVGLLPGESVVVWGGGAPACEFVNNFFESSQNSLALNNSGDSIIILPAGVGTTPIVQTSFSGAQAVTGVSNNLSPDITGTVYVRHNLVPNAVGNFSPGFLSDQSFF
ncbi:MAG: lamin tail domain-containing protein, partial [Kofleriaceae bacterium]